MLEAIATANPPLCRSQDYAISFMQRIESIPQRIRARIPDIYARSGIDFRYSCVEDYGTEPDSFNFYPRNWRLEPAPSTAARNAKYRASVIPLGERVARSALEAAAIEPQDITHVIVVSCTGFFAPGLDIELVKRLGLPETTQRTFIGFMGCYAAFNAFRVADAFCKADPRARVLIVCAELCTLHFQNSQTLESAIINGIFSDGAAAAIVSSRAAEEARGGLAYARGLALLDADSMADMTWDVGDTGFMMGLSSRVPGVLARQLPSYVERLRGSTPSGSAGNDFWAIHPGGRAIIDQARDVLGLTEEDVMDSTEVLRLYGNMSSPTILFVLRRVLERHQASVAGGGNGCRRGVALAFGPGLTLEGALFERIDA